MRRDTCVVAIALGVVGLGIWCNVNGQINPSIPLQVRPMQLESPLLMMQQIEAIRATQAQAEQTAAQTRLLQEQTRAIEQQNEQMRRAAASQSAAPTQPDPLLEAWLKAAGPRIHLYPDFQQVVFAPDLNISTDMIRLMSASPYAADIAYYFGTHRIEATAVAQLSIVEAARAIEGIEARVKVAAPNANISAPSASAAGKKCMVSVSGTWVGRTGKECD